MEDPRPPAAADPAPDLDADLRVLGELDADMDAVSAVLDALRDGRYWRCEVCDAQLEGPPGEVLAARRCARHSVA